MLDRDRIGKSEFKVVVVGEDGRDTTDDLSRYLTK